MRDKIALKIAAVSIALLIAVSCATVLVAVSISDVSPSQVTLIPGETVTGELEDEGSCDYYQVHVGSGEHLFVVLEDLSSEYNQNELCIKYGSLPNRTSYDDKFDIPNNPDQAVEISNTQEGYYYVLVYADYVYKSSGTRYNITAYMTGMNNPPVASFNYSPGNPVVNQTITFNASSSYDPDGSITNYEWDFGDGNITKYEWVFGDGNNRTGEIVNHLYASSGNYNVTLTVTDNDGATNATSKMIKVQQLPVLEILAPTTDNPANAGPSNNPHQIFVVARLDVVDVNGDGAITMGDLVHLINALVSSTVLIGEEKADIINIALGFQPPGPPDPLEWLIGNMTINPPKQESAGYYNLTVIVNVSGTDISDTEIDAVYYEEVSLCGDVAPYPDGDGNVNMGDVVRLLNHVANPEEFPVDPWAGDCKCSGEINMGDVILLLNHVDDPDEFPLECC